MITACLHCGGPIPTTASRRADGRGRFCSRSCAGKHRVGRNSARWTHGRYCRTELRCQRCGVRFVGQRKQKFCSRTCARRPRTYLTCDNCGRSFYGGHLKRRFCSKRCTNESMRVATRKPRSTATAAARRAQRRVAHLIRMGVLVRPNTCEECGRRVFIEAAHWNYDQPEVVRWLCRTCHRTWDHAEPKGGTVESMAATGVAEEKAPTGVGANGGGS